MTNLQTSPFKCAKRTSKSVLQNHQHAKANSNSLFTIPAYSATIKQLCTICKALATLHRPTTKRLTPSSTHWQALKPRNLHHALDLCVNYANAHHNLSTAAIARLMGVKKHQLHHWLRHADMPMHQLKNFEQACGHPYVSRWLIESTDQTVTNPTAGTQP